MGWNWVKDDGGRAEAGYASIYGDCMYRSLAIAAQMPFIAARTLIVEAIRLERAAAPRAPTMKLMMTAQPKVMEALGWPRTVVRQKGQPRQWLEPEQLPLGRLVVLVGGGSHFLAVIDRVVHDSQEPSRNCEHRRRERLSVYHYWSSCATITP